MTEREHVPDEELTAFLDGETGGAARLALAARLAREPALRTRLAALDLDRGALKDAFDTLLPAAPAAPGPSRIEAMAATARARRRRPWLQGAAIAASLGAGIALGGLAAGPAETGWQDHAAAYHVLYTTETLSAVDASPGRLARQVARVGDALGRPLPMDVLAGVEGLTLRRAQILGLADRPLAQIAYLAGDVPVALCILRGVEDGARARRVAVLEGMAAVTWAADGYGYLLIGGDDVALLDAAAAVLGAGL
ncbi:MAG: hypothetical protein AAFR52_05770 [Pseudomonadota bacterium]